jgi:hypothetical protein
VQFDAARLQRRDGVRRIESRAKDAVELGRYEDIAFPEPGDQGAAGGPIGERNRARNAFLDDYALEREAPHEGVAFDLAPLDLEAVAVCRLLCGRDANAFMRRAKKIGRNR